MSLLELRSYVTDIKKDDKNSHGYRAASSFSMLEHIDLMMNRYLKEEQTEKPVKKRTGKQTRLGNRQATSLWHFNQERQGFCQISR